MPSLRFSPYREIASAVASRLGAAREGMDPLAPWEEEVIVPSRGVAEAVAAKLLAQIPSGVAGLQLQSLETLATRILAAAGQTPRVAAEGERRLAMRLAVRSVDDPMMGSRGVAAMLERSYRDMRDSGLTLAQFTRRVEGARGLRSEGRTRLALRAWTEYERLIAHLSAIDPADLLQRAARIVGPSVKPQLVAGFYDMTGAQRHLLEALLRANRVTAIWVPTEAPFAQAFVQSLAEHVDEARRNTGVPPAGPVPSSPPGGESGPSEASTAPARGRDAAQPAGGMVTQYDTLLEELRDVCARVAGLLAAGTPANEIGIVARSLEAYDARLLNRFAAEHGFTTTLGEEIPLAAHRIGRGALTLLRLRERGFPRTGVLGLVRDGLRTKTRIDANAADAETRRSRIAGGTSEELRRRRSRSAIIDAYIALVEELEGLTATIDLSLLSRLGSLFRVETDADLAAAEELDEVAALFRRFGSAALADVIDAIEQRTRGAQILRAQGVGRGAQILGAQGAGRGAQILRAQGAGRGAQILRAQGAGRRAQEIDPPATEEPGSSSCPLPPAPCALNPCPLPPAPCALVWAGEIPRFRGRSFTHLFAIRMQDDVFPQRRTEDPLLPDSDRRLLGMREIGDGREEEQLLFSLLADAASAHLHFSYAGGDGFGKVLRPSRFIRSAPVAGRSARVERQLPTRDGQRQLQLLVQAGTRSVFDGYVPGIDPTTLRLSPTQLEDFGECPQKFLLKHVLGVRDIDQPEREIQIHHRDKGTLDHKILERFYRSLTEDELHAAHAALPQLPDALGERLDGFVDEQFDEHEGDAPPFNRTVRDIERRATRRILREFVVHDLADLMASDLAPRWFEYRFGAKHRELADHPDPFVVEVDGVPVRVEGTIDRIDIGRVSTHHRIVDYKSGKALRHAGLGDKIDRGVRLQLALYAMAVSDFFGIEPADVSAAIKPIVTGDVKPASFAFALAEKRETLLETLRIFIRAITAGTFPAFPNEKDSEFNSCKYCPVNHSCRTKHDLEERYAVQQQKDPRTLLGGGT